MLSKDRISFLVEKLELIEHPEGGYYKEVYRSEGIMKNDSLPTSITGTRNYCTSIYFLLTSENFSAFHRIQQDEIWHFYEGSPLHVHVIDHNGEYHKHTIGNNLEANEELQMVVTSRQWFASSVKEKDSYSLVGCTVSPGFDFKDFELAKRADLVASYPNHEKEIKSLTRV
jgi:predicted cupin superfamily sugar epimerase